MNARVKKPPNWSGINGEHTDRPLFRENKERECYSLCMGCIITHQKERKEDKAILESWYTHLVQMLIPHGNKPGGLVQWLCFVKPENGRPLSLWPGQKRTEDFWLTFAGERENNEREKGGPDPFTQPKLGLHTHRESATSDLATPATA